MVKNVILADPFEEDPPFWLSQILSNFYLSLYLLILKISCV